MFGQITFQKMYGGANFDVGFSVQQTSDGGYIVSGGTASLVPGNSDIYLIKTNANGDTLWTRTFGGSGIDFAYFIQQTYDGGYIIAGYTSSFGIDSSDVYLIKTDVNGNLLWSKIYDGTGYSEGRYVQQTSDGGYIVAGSCASLLGVNHIYLIKTDANGDTLWTKTSSTNATANVIKRTLDGSYIIIGSVSSLSSGNGDIYLLKIDSVGNPLWSKTFGGGSQEAGYSGQQTIDGGYIIAGYTYSFGGVSSDVYLIKTNSIGDTLWTKTFGGAPNTDGASSIQQTNDGGYIITGWTESFGAGNNDAYLIKTDVNGNLIWSKTFGGTYIDNGYSVQQTSDGGYIVAGSCASFGGGYPNVYLIKTDANGNSGCYESNSATIVGSPPTQVTNPVIILTSSNTFVTNSATISGSGGIVNTLCTTVNINEETAGGSFLISPNPSAGNFTVGFSDILRNGIIELYNVLGEKFYFEKINHESEKKISLKNISQGIYFVKVFDGERSYCKKLIVE